MATLGHSGETSLIRWRRWWQLRSPAERALAVAVAAFVLAAIAWLLLWQPLLRDSERLERRLSQQRVALEMARRQVDEIATLGRTTVVPGARDARSDVETALARQGLKAAAVERGDDQRVRITLEAISFDGLASILDGLQRDARLTAAELSAAARVEPGQVRADVTLSPPR
jgi:type II secretory pathway component PulM